MPLPVMRTKLTSERIRVEFNFASELLLGETISNPVVEVQVATGLDLTPEDMIASRKFLDSPKVFQWIVGGVPGVIYNLICTVQGSSGKQYKLERKLAVLPVVNLRPPLFGVSYSTTIYPINSQDNLTVDGSLLLGRLFGTIEKSIIIEASITGGELKTIFKEYLAPFESVFVNAAITGGQLLTPLVTYNVGDERLNAFGIIISGELKTILIIYSNYPPESLNMSGAITGGTLA